jgi:hypothetical protein
MVAHLVAQVVRAEEGHGGIAAKLADEIGNLLGADAVVCAVVAFGIFVI